MADSKQQAYDGWSKLLNPEVLKSNLIAASIFIAGHESLIGSITDPLKDFFSIGFDKNGPRIGEKYKTAVLELDKNPVRASLLWLKEIDAINEQDVVKFDEIRAHRNALAHEMPRFLGEADANINVELLGTMIELIAKLDRWWIQNVEIPTDPDYDGSEVDDAEIISMRMMVMTLLLHTAAGEDLTPYWADFQEQTRTGA